MELIENNAKRRRRRIRQDAQLDEPETVLEEPTPKRATGGARVNEWRKASTSALLVLTVILALILNAPLLAMTDLESAALGEPLGNILARSPLNRRIGKRIVDADDYLALTWASILYLARVQEEVKRNNAFKTVRNPQPGAEPANFQPGNTPTTKQSDDAAAVQYPGTIQRVGRD